MDSEMRVRNISSFLLPLCLGVAIGFLAATVLLPEIDYHGRQEDNIDDEPAGILERFVDGRFLDGHEGKNEGSQDVLVYNKRHEEAHKAEEELAGELARKVRVLCWIMTQPDNHEKKARHVKATWGKRCNVLLFMSTTNDPSIPTVSLPSIEGRNQLWNKTKEAFMYVYKNHYHEADWFMKADDDTYVIVENLRHFLADHSPQDPVWFGCHFKKYVSNGYMSGGAGYVMSKESLRRLIEEGLPDKTKCSSDRPASNRVAEDKEMGKCLENIGVYAGDSRDAEGKWRFLPFTPYHHLIPGHLKKDHWFWKWTKYPYTEGPDCCSDSAITFHYVKPSSMYVFDYLIYHLKPFGRVPHFELRRRSAALPSDWEYQTHAASVEPLEKARKSPDY